MQTDCIAIMDKVRAAQRELEKTIADLANAVPRLPDNPKIRRITSSPAIFTLSAKSLDPIWSVEYHDFEIQYKIIHAQMVKHPLDVTDWWMRVRTAGKIKIGDDRMLFLHPDVVKHVDKLLGIE